MCGPLTFRTHQTQVSLHNNNHKLTALGGKRKPDSIDGGFSRDWVREVTHHLWSRTFTDDSVLRKLSMPSVDRKEHILGMRSLWRRQLGGVHLRLRTASRGGKAAILLPHLSSDALANQHLLLSRPQGPGEVLLMPFLSWWTLIFRARCEDYIWGHDGQWSSFFLFLVFF